MTIHGRSPARCYAVVRLRKGLARQALHAGALLRSRAVRLPLDGEGSGLASRDPCSQKLCFCFRKHGTLLY